MIPTRRFGRTGLAMPVFSCGGMRYQESWEDLPPEKIPEANQKNLEATIHRSLELGINHIETARGYGTSEYQLGRLLPTLPRKKLIIQTKIAPDRTGDEFLKTFETSMANLRLDHVDLLSLHGINTAELLENSLRPGGPLEAARRLQRDGRVRFIGFSTHGPTDVIVDTIETGEFDYVNLHWYWVNQINRPAIEAATRHDMGVFIISPNDKGGKLYEPPEKLVRLCAPFSPMAFNNLFCLLRPEVHTLSLGAARPSDFDEHIRSLVHWTDAPSLVAEIDARLRAALAEPLGADWSQGIPRWEQIPGGVNVWEILRLWVLAKGLDMVAFGKMRYNLLGQGGHWFPGKNAAGFDEPALRAALATSPLSDRIPDILREAHALFFEKPAERLGRD
jgi:predicted aldo/keto reductase-like oxidoreductase